jgi:hypothetical protein
MSLFERVTQGSDHDVNCNGVVHALAPAKSMQPVGSPAHGLSSTCDTNVRITGKYLLSNTRYGLQAASTQSIHRERWSLDAEAGLEGYNAREVHIPGFGMDHISEHQLLHFLCINPRSPNGLAGRKSAQLCRPNILKCSSIFANGSTSPAQNDYFPSVGHALAPAEVDFPKRSGSLAATTSAHTVRRSRLLQIK